MLIAVYLTIIVNLLIIIHLNQRHSHYNRYNHPCEPNFHQEQCNLIPPNEYKINVQLFCEFLHRNHSKNYYRGKMSYVRITNKLRSYKFYEKIAYVFNTSYVKKFLGISSQLFIAKTTSVFNYN
jgi:hypothetical protein